MPPKVSIRHQKSEGEKALKVKHNQFNHTPKNDQIYSVKKLHTTQSQMN